MYFDLQKASFLKRIVAWILDFILITILATGFSVLVSNIVGQDAQNEKLDSIYKKYSEKYNIDIGISREEYNQLPAEKQAIFDQINEEMSADDELNYNYRITILNTVVILSVSILLAISIVDFTIPLFLKNGQTIGKKVFGIAVMQKDQMKLHTLPLAIRTFLGKFTVETMIPVLTFVMIFFGFAGNGRIGIVINLILLLIQLFALIKTNTNSAIHDLLAGTVTVDMKSQMIFESEEQMEEYRKKLEEKTDEKRGL